MLGQVGGAAPARFPKASGDDWLLRALAGRTPVGLFGGCEAHPSGLRSASRGSNGNIKRIRRVNMIKTIRITSMMKEHTDVYTRYMVCGSHSCI